MSKNRRAREQKRQGREIEEIEAGSLMTVLELGPKGLGLVRGPGTEKGAGAVSGQAKPA